MIVLNICLSDIPKEKIETGNNGKKYVKLTVNQRKQADNYGNTHSIAMSKSKEERDAKVDTVYVGSGKEYDFGNNSQEFKPNPATHNNVAKDDSNDDLPF